MAEADYDSSFRTWQAVADLIHHVGPLAKQHFAALARASGLTPGETGAALTLLRDDHFVFQRDDILPLMGGLETLAIARAEGFDLAVVILLADLLQTRRASGRLAKAWEEAALRLKDWPATLRAAVANGLVRAAELQLVALTELPRPANCLTRGAAEISDALLPIARSMRPDELLAVAQADYGSDVERHLQALRAVIGQRDGIFLPEESWYPSEVVELTAHVPGKPGHEGCTAILLLNVLKHGDRQGWFDFRWENQCQAYVALQPSRRDPILAGIRFLYETDRGFLIYNTVDFNPAHAGREPETVHPVGLTIPVVDEL